MRHVRINVRYVNVTCVPGPFWLKPLGRSNTCRDDIKTPTLLALVLCCTGGAAGQGRSACTLTQARAGGANTPTTALQCPFPGPPRPGGGTARRTQTHGYALRTGPPAQRERLRLPLGYARSNTHGAKTLPRSFTQPMTARGSWPGLGCLRTPGPSGARTLAFQGMGETLRFRTSRLPKVPQPWRGRTADRHAPGYAPLAWSSRPLRAKG